VLLQLLLHQILNTAPFNVIKQNRVKVPELLCYACIS